MRLLALFAIAVIPLTATAQMGDVLPGARVRVIVHGGRLAGALVSRTTDSLLIAQTTSGSGAPAPRISLGLQSVESIDVYEGRNRVRAAIRAGLWTGVGVTLLSLLAQPDTTRCRPHCLSKATTLVLGNLIVDPMAAAIGGAIGMDVWKSHRPADLAHIASPTVSRVAVDQAAVPMVGARVRITAPGVLADRLDATIRRTPDSLIVATPEALEYGVALASVREIERFDGRSGKQGAKKGFVLGALIGLPFVLFVPTDATCHVACAVGIAAYVDATYGGIGAAIGAAVGADRWTTVPLRPSISALPNGRFGVGLNLRQRLSTCGARF